MYHSVLPLHSSVYVIPVILLSDRSVQYHTSDSSSLIFFINSPSYIVPQCGTVLFHHPFFVVYPSIHPPFLVLHNPSLSSLIQRATVSSSSVYSMNLTTHPLISVIPHYSVYHPVHPAFCFAHTLNLYSSTFNHRYLLLYDTLLITAIFSTLFLHYFFFYFFRHSTWLLPHISIFSAFVTFLSVFLLFRISMYLLYNSQ
jgi:hypothetical protein